MSSIAEVARRAGVSIATASRVVSDADYPVSPATRERVLEAAQELDYVPTALARGLLKSRVPVVGVIVHDITDPYFAEVVRGVEDGANASGFLVITCSSERDPERERSYVRLLRSIRAAAVIFAGSGLDNPDLAEEVARHVAAMRAAGSAVVHLSPHALGTPDVTVDNTAGMAGMVAALAAVGHRRIAYLAGPTALFVARDRLEGYRRGLAAAGIAFDERLVACTSFDQDGGALGIATLLATGEPFTAVCCANDLLALGALRALAARGIAVPDEVSVAGFDDISITAMTAPSLSTVRLPLRAMGRRGFAHVDRVLAGEPLDPEVLPTELVLRGSTAAPGGAAGSRWRLSSATEGSTARRITAEECPAEEHTAAEGQLAAERRAGDQGPLAAEEHTAAEGRTTAEMAGTGGIA